MLSNLGLGTMQQTMQYGVATMNLWTESISTISAAGLTTIGSLTGSVTGIPLIGTQAMVFSTLMILTLFLSKTAEEVAQTQISSFLRLI